MGYDWGASISMRLGVKHGNNLFDKIISFMPAYGETEDYKDELTKLSLKTLILWVK